MKTKKRVFTKKHYMSGDGMLTAVWGPSLWHYLHTMSFNYPVKPTSKHKKYYKQFIQNLSFTLPCKHCRDNLIKNLKFFPIKECHLKDRETFSRYIFLLHDDQSKSIILIQAKVLYNHQQDQHYKLKPTKPTNTNVCLFNCNLHRRIAFHFFQANFHLLRTKLL